MSWLGLLGRKKSPVTDGQSTTGKPRGPIRRWLRRLVLLAAALFLFSALVSVVGLLKAPAIRIEAEPDSSARIQEITQLYPVVMNLVVQPKTVEEIGAAVASNPGPISIGGGRYSMGGQTATPDGLQLDMREYRGVVAFDPHTAVITVRSGTRWREVQQAIDSAGLSVKIMQTYDNFTVGGALSVNAHGRYIGEGPLVRSVRSITLVLADGRVITASPTQNAEMFYGAIGGYGALGVIADVTLDLAANTKVRRDDSTVATTDYLAWFRGHVREDRSVIFHNGDMYPPEYDRVHAVSYRTTELPLTVSTRIQPADQASWTHRLAYSIMAGGRSGLWIREHIIDPWIFRGHPVTWRNYEASYDVSELEPSSRARQTFVLQEYFIPVDSFGSFVPRMKEIFNRHHADVINVSIRHALPDPGTMLAWAPTETFAFVVYYRQGTGPGDRREVARWTREMIDAVAARGGRYYLPYQPVATREQFTRAYPGAARLLELKRRVDPTTKFTNVLWDLYAPAADGSMPPVTAARMPAALPGEIQIALDSTKGWARDQADAWYTHPEWDLVYSSEAYADWLTAGKAPSQFPYLRSVGTFWRSYLDARSAARPAYSTAFGTHLMLWVIGLSTAAEYGLKGVYEQTVGHFFEWIGPGTPTEEEIYAAKVNRDYVALINVAGWYEFNFAGALRGLWRDVPFFGHGFLRKIERRAVLTGEFAIKAVYGWFIGLGTGAAYSADESRRLMVVAGWSDSLAASIGDSVTATPLYRGYALLSVPRYAPYR
ncbi:MAG TPA: FAD-binding oxidoreductase, partial [Gemmatimonadales bacterium]|nr:FAD-binding oxidoreductase [Gemmatimonadales bacterium]